MKRWFRILLVIICFTGLGPVKSKAQTWLHIRIDSLSTDTITDNGSIAGTAFLINDSLPFLSTSDSFLSIYASYKGNQITAPNFQIIFMPPGIIGQGDSVSFQFLIANPDTAPLPQISPGGGSVVVWPVYLNVAQGHLTPATFTIYYNAVVNGIDNGDKDISRVLYNRHRIDVYFTGNCDVQAWLLDISGKLITGTAGNKESAGFNLEGLAPGIYMIRLQRGQKSKSLKFVHY